MYDFYTFKYDFMIFLKKAKNFLAFMVYRIITFFTPVKKNKIVISCFSGRSAGGNVKYIVKEILKQKLPYELVWLCDKNFLQDSNELDGVRFIQPKNRLEKTLELASARLWLEDSLKTFDYSLGLYKKKNQTYINTWHGSLGIKKLFFDTSDYKNSPTFLTCLKKEFQSYCDIMLSNCKWEDDVFRRAFRFNKKIERIGHPKNDIFFENREQYRKKVYEYLNIPLDKKIAFYMPSFRNYLRSEPYKIDYDRIKEALEKRFDGEWVVVSRFHYFNTKNIKSVYGKCESIYDATYYSDPQEILASADALISDYSSCMFDFILTNRPCFIFASDINLYNIERGFYYPLNETPFSVAQNNDELVKNILTFDNEIYQKKCYDFMKVRNVLEDGRASYRAVEIIKEILSK